MELILENLQITYKSFKLPYKMGGNCLVTSHGNDSVIAFYRPSSGDSYQKYSTVLVDVSSVIGDTITIRSTDNYATSNYRAAFLPSSVNIDFEEFPDDIGLAVLVDLPNAVEKFNLVSTIGTSVGTVQKEVPSGAKWLVFNFTNTTKDSLLAKPEMTVTE